MGYPHQHKAEDYPKAEQGQLAEYVQSCRGWSGRRVGAQRMKTGRQNCMTWSTACISPGARFHTEQALQQIRIGTQQQSLAGPIYSDIARGWYPMEAQSWSFDSKLR